MDLDGLRRVPLFAALPPGRLARLAAAMPVRSLPVGQVVAAAGEPAVRLVVLERGSVVGVRDTVGGTAVRLATVVAPGVIDKVAALGGGVHTATWTTAAPARVRSLPSAQLRRLVDEVPAVREHVLRWLAAEADRQRRSRVRATGGPVARVADRLIEAGAVAGAAVRLTGGQQGLGEELGLSRVTVNRALRVLVAAGAVRVAPGLVHVLDVGLLAAAAGQPR
ncbi:Crp/Fnr family transcriptional regulator [Pseudonocardia humida]|uniref:Crp/Fnr family transcriptional regulator n=1 Tax=Pseudonocardia humida TaxID=2800819 RepID=A0ABT1A8Z6_9PSEU|nr:Crp/Fnr family transcriptional regulator [Pseudonocardia humida]MCO1659473.1 Crp/Fnr family transcriptional regulator [Pseudonocardia humida]